ncbi:amidohydrolase family protein [Mycetocola spongiae]|uniref:amidohydrolase family protein n=1 Tax=Mycetocola spongiae TaxID=2859226 RepID=UPI001CF392DD|nr:amidohydrolase family protein [Mycetocola spongiae]UCR89807.1 amidohydrolase family protein [Mycetocola spongiae]
MHNPVIAGRPTVQGISIIDFHLHFRMGQDPLTRSLSGGQLGASGGPAESICDIHAGGLATREAAVRETSAQWRRSWDFADPEAAELDRGSLGEALRWREELARNGVEHAAFVTAGGDGEMRELVERGEGQFSGMAAMADPFAPGAAAAAERAFGELGLRGLKIFAPLMTRRIDDPGADPVWALAAQYNVPVLIHFGHCGSAGGIAHNDFIEPAWLEAVAKRFPSVTFVIPHFGIQHVQQVLFLMWACPNVIVDTSGSNQWVRYMAQKLTLEDLFRRFYETFGPERVVFGSDSSWFPRGFARRYLTDQLRICWEMGMPARDIQAIFGGNAARLLGLGDWVPADSTLA